MRTKRNKNIVFFQGKKRSTTDVDILSAFSRMLSDLKIKHEYSFGYDLDTKKKIEFTALLRIEREPYEQLIKKIVIKKRDKIGRRKAKNKR